MVDCVFVGSSVTSNDFRGSDVVSWHIKQWETADVGIKQFSLCFVKCIVQLMKLVIDARKLLVL